MVDAVIDTPLFHAQESLNQRGKFQGKGVLVRCSPRFRRKESRILRGGSKEQSEDSVAKACGRSIAQKIDTLDPDRRTVQRLENDETLLEKPGKWSWILVEQGGAVV